MVEIEHALRELRLLGMQQTLSTRAMQAQTSQEPFLETFAAMLQDELDRRRSVLTERRYKSSTVTRRCMSCDRSSSFPSSRCYELRP